MLSIRAANATDLPLVFRQERAYIQDFEPDASVGWHKAIDRHLEQWTDHLSRMFVAEQEGQAVGFYFWQPDGTDAVLASVHVLAAHRRKGIGARLLEHFEQDARASGFSRLTLGVLPTNPALALYEQAGYGFAHEEGGYRYFLKTTG